MLNKADNIGITLLLSTDVVVADSIDTGANTQILPVDKIPQDKIIVDIGPDTIAKFSETLRNCKTVLYRGHVSRVYQQGNS